MRVVRPLEDAATVQLVRPSSADWRDSFQLAAGLLRVLLPGAGQPDRVPRQRGAFQLDAAEGDTGGDHAGRFRDIQRHGVQGRDVPLESSRGVYLPGAGCLFRVYEVIVYNNKGGRHGKSFK